MSKKSAPPPTGYTAPGQGTPGVYQQATEAEAQANRPNQNTDFASSGWTKGPDGNWTQNTSLAPGLQDSLFNLEGQAGSATSTPLPNGADARKAASDSWYNQETSRLDPYWKQQDDNVQTQLLNQGYVPGTEGYDKAYANFSRAKNDAYSTASNTAIQHGGDAAQQQQQMDINQRSMPFSLMNILKSLTSMPGFNPGPQYLGAAQGTSNYNLQNQQMENQGWGNLMGGLFNMGGMLGGAALMPKMPAPAPAMGD